MFQTIKARVRQRFDEIVRNDLFVVTLEKNELFDAYLAALPENERQHHNCNCCKSFLNHYGSVVAIQGTNLLTMWEFEVKDTIYEAVPDALDALVRAKVIEKPFLSTFDKLGTDSNRQLLESGEVIRWEHFHVVLPKEKVTRSSESIDSLVGKQVTTKQVFERGLKTLTIDAADTVLGLIHSNTLYRGQEYLKSVESFAKHAREYQKLNSDAARSLYAWANYKEGGRIRNTAIGTLLIDLSEGMDLERAVRAYETVVAPANFKRTTALVTPAMVKKAQETIENLGFTPSLKRRHATADDIPLVNLLFVNRTREQVSVFDEMAAEAPVNPKSFARAQSITLDDLIGNVLPTATSMKLLLENGHNFVSLIAPEDPEAPSMFAWSNSISWTYESNNADAIKQKVSKAGGKIDGELRISLEWFNHDDLDLHVIEPGGFHIHYASKRSPFSNGTLDVDMNVGMYLSREPVENVVFDRARIKEGTYQVIVHNFTKRETTDIGFNVEIECQGQTFNLNHAVPMRDKQQIQVASFNYSRARGIHDFHSALDQSVAHKEVNGLLTNRFQDVKMLMFSPNHWTDMVGNKHLFFILDKARIDTPLRPFFNEYLNHTLTENRKVLEVLGSKLMVPPADKQLTGVGFSLTQRFEPLIKVNNTVYRLAI